MTPLRELLALLVRLFHRPCKHLHTQTRVVGFRVEGGRKLLEHEVRCVDCFRVHRYWDA